MKQQPLHRQRTQNIDHSFHGKETATLMNLIVALKLKEKCKKLDTCAQQRSVGIRSSKAEVLLMIYKLEDIAPVEHLHSI